MLTALEMSVYARKCHCSRDVGEQFAEGERKVKKGRQ